VSKKRYADVKTWKDQCTIWCRSHNLTAPHTVQEFVAVACGVAYSPLENFPHDLAIGVAHYGHVVRGEWRRFADKVLFKPSPRHVRYRESPVRIGFSF
jgi:hypothetical protein